MASRSDDVLKRQCWSPGICREIVVHTSFSSSSCLYEVRGGRCVVVGTSLTAISGTLVVATEVEVDDGAVSSVIV